MLKVNLPSFKINQKEILKDISLNIQDRESLTILGSNGAGKSTLARIVCGLLPTKESIKIENNFIENIDHKQRSKLINYIPPKLSIYDSFITAEDFLSLSTHESQNIQKILKLLEIGQHKKSYASTLSSGEQQLLLLASAITHNAKLTIFDEPTSNLDPQKIKKVYDILKNPKYLKEKIIITHDLQFAYKLSFPIFYLNNGEGEYFETTNDFFNKNNLEKIFDGNVIKKDDNIVIKL